MSLTTAVTWLNGRMTGMTTPSGQVIGYSYGNGRVSGVTVNGATLVTAAGYEPFGPVSVWQWGNGHKTYRDHDADGRLTTWEYRNGASILRRDLTWDNANRITAIADPGNGTNSATYGYDVLDRLTSALANGVTRGYGYDAIGNRTASNVDAASTTYTYPGTSHRLQSLTGATTRSYAYDAAGNPTQIDAAVHGYNLANRLTSVSSTSSASYKVNALGQRVAKTVDGVTTRYVYDEQGRLIGEYQADGTLIQETVWLDDLPVATLRPTGSGTPTPVAVYYVHADHLGSPRAITRPTDDQIVWRWDNAEPFGANAANENPSGLGNFRYDLRFPGQQYDPETATHYNYFRDYDPTTGRYRQSDPIGLAGARDSFAYVRNSPVGRIDRWGWETALHVSAAAAAGRTLHLMQVGFPWFVKLPFPIPVAIMIATTLWSSIKKRVHNPETRLRDAIQNEPSVGLRGDSLQMSVLWQCPYIRLTSRVAEALKQLREATHSKTCCRNYRRHWRPQFRCRDR
ncbi:MAG: RHS repeat-associated core domain-containing protein [Burkholderiales bacterium]